MKTVLVGVDPISPSKGKLDYNQNRPKMFLSNIKNMQSVQVNKISQLIKKNNFRDSRNIFFLKVAQKQKNRSSILPNLQMSNNKYSVNSALSAENVTLGKVGVRETDQNQENYDRFQIKQFDDKEEDLYGQNTERKYHREPQFYQKTLYIYKKKSLNSELNFFKSYNRYQKSKTIDNSNCFNAQLIGIQKRFTNKISPLSKIKSKKQLKSKQKQISILSNTFQLQSIDKSINKFISHDKCGKKDRVRIGLKKKEKEPKTQRLFRLRQSLKMNQTIKHEVKPIPKQSLFTPWKVSQQLQSYNE